MSKIGVSIKLDVTKIDKSRLFKGAKGTYLDLTGFINIDEEDQYGNHGFISQSTTKEEREAGVQTPILGNTKVFFSDLQVQQFQQGAHPQHQAPVFTPQPTVETFSKNGDGTQEDILDDDVPF